MSSQQPPRWRPPGPPTSIMIYPDPGRDCWRHSQSGPELGILCGDLDLSASALPVEARQVAENMLADVGRTDYHLDLTVDWNPADARGWITGTVRAAQALSGS